MRQFSEGIRTCSANTLAGKGFLKRDGAWFFHIKIITFKKGKVLLPEKVFLKEWWTLNRIIIIRRSTFVTAIK